MNKILSFIKYAIPAVMGAFMMTGCVEEYEAELPDNETHLLVVNGTICSNTFSLFHLTWSTSLNNKKTDYVNDYLQDTYSIVDPVLNARVTICGSDGSEYECTAYDSGIYGCYTPELNSNTSYYITIRYDNDVYQSAPEKPIRTPELELEYFQKDSLSNIEVLLSTGEPDDPNQTTYYTWEYAETWEIRPTRTTSIYFDLATQSRQYLTPAQQYPDRGWKFGNNETILTESTAHYEGGKFTKYQLLNIPRDDERITWNYCNDVTQRAISKAEYEYNMACIQAGWDMGGLFSPQPSALPTNIRCTTSSKRAIGYVGCSQNVAYKRIYIDGTQISREQPEPGPYIKLPDCSEYDCYKMADRGLVLYIWDDGRMVQKPLVTYWAYPEDFDVRLRGATTIKPEYMPPFYE